MLRFALLILTLLALPRPALADDVSAAARSVVRVVVVANEDGEIADFSHGSGFAVAPNRIVTNAHVVTLAREYPDSYIVGVVPSEGDQSYAARVVAIDPAKDLALLEIVDARIPPVPLYTGPLPDGGDVVALGYPGNVDMATAQSATDFITPASPTRSRGNFSNERRISGTHALLHTANVARGHSGGPLVDTCGRVIGVNTFITANQEGDAPFAFAIATRELAGFLRAAGQNYVSVSSECISMSEALRREEARRGRTAGESRAAAEEAEQAALARAMAENEDKRENHTALGLLLGVVGLAGLGGAGLMLLKDRPKPGYTLAGLGLLLLAGGAGVFFTRPARGDLQISEIQAKDDKASFVGANLCRLVPERSRITVSQTEDVELRWSENGCVNGRTQYVKSGDSWSRILVPEDEATVSVTEFRPDTGEYVVTRYLMSAGEMTKLRALRSQIELRSCTRDDRTLARLDDRQEMIRSALPQLPNEQLVYQCRRRGG
jgi:S1-C subfamily serine protease